MASKKSDDVPPQQSQEGALPEFVRPEGLISLVQRYAQYDPLLDVRDRRATGRKGAPLHGLLIGARELPATIPDPQTGELKPWNVLVIELLQTAPVKDSGRTPADDRRRMALPPEHIIVTSSTAINSIRERFGLDHAIGDPDRVYEIYLEPEAATTKAGLSLWVFPTFEMGKPRQRTTMQKLNPFADIQKAAAAIGPTTGARALPLGTAHINSANLTPTPAAVGANTPV